MSDLIQILAASRFEAARAVGILPEGHRARKLHGHSFIAKVRAGAAIDVHTVDGSRLSTMLSEVTSCLDYRLLNEVLGIPTDENLARWVWEQLKTRLNSNAPLVPQNVGIQSTIDQGVDLDHAGHAHVWHRFRFEAAHQLPNVPTGHQCGRMHGHGFEIVLHADKNLEASSDLSIDFDVLAAEWRFIAMDLDQRCLNSIPGLENPTSEMIAQWIWLKLKPRIPQLSWITVYETVTAGCHFDGSRHRIWKEMRFESALLEQDVSANAKPRLLGHSYVLRLHLSSPIDSVLGWTVDYGDVKKLFEPIYKKLDHHFLNEIEGISGVTPVEIIHWMRSQIADVIPQLDRIDLYETASSGVSVSWGEYSPALPS